MKKIKGKIKYGRLFIIFSILILLILVPNNTYSQNQQTPQINPLWLIFNYEPNNPIWVNYAGSWTANQLGKLGVDIIESLFNPAIVFIINILQNIAGFILYLGANLITILFQTNTRITDYPIVIMAWQIVRDIANLGFVIAFIVMAFMTILRISSYNAQKMFFKLVTAIILVNFSMTIAGFILDFTNVVTKFFVDRALGGGDIQTAQDIGKSIVTVFSPQNLLKTKDLTSGYDITDTERYENPNTIKIFIQNIVSLFAILIFTFFMAFLLLAYALMLLTRSVYLSILIAISPIAWLLGVIPIGEFKKTGSWWNSFLEWAFVAPILSFFIYITIVTSINMEELLRNVTNIVDNDVFTSIDDFWNQIMNILIIGGFLAAGLISSKKMGGALAGNVVGLSQKWGKALGNATLKFGKSKVTNAGRRIMTAGAASDKEGKSWAEKLGESRLGKIPVLGAAFRGIAGTAVKAKQASQKDIDEAKKKYDLLSKDTLKNRIESQIVSKNIGALNESDVAAAFALAEKGGWHELSNKTRNKLITAMKRMGVANKLSSFDPVAAYNIGIEKDLKKAVQKVENPAKIFSTEESLKQVAPYLSKNQINNIALEGSQKQQDWIRDGLLDSFVPANAPQNEKTEVVSAFDKLEKKKKELNDLLKQYQDAIERRDDKEVEAIQKVKGVLTQNIKDLEKTIKEGGQWTEMVPVDGQSWTDIVSQVKAGQDITRLTAYNTRINLTQPSTQTEKERRKSAFAVTKAISKSTKWQGKKLFQEPKKSDEEEED
jgi:hypothetical protein